MTTDRIKDLLFELVELPAAQQLDRLSVLDATVPDLARELRSLLGHSQLAPAGLEAPERLLGHMRQAELPTQVGPWRVTGELGRGGMGVVLRAERADGAFEKQVAIKVLPPLLAGGEATQRFVQEARLLAPLDHPHIARLIDAGVAQGCAYFVMDLVEGLPITRSAAPLPLKARLKLFLQLASAVSFAHGRLLIHRDIKPANVLVDIAGQVRLLDFGIAKLVSASEATQTAHSQAFTPAYASPEQMRGEPATVASDVFSLGVVLYELCAQAHPFLGAKGETARQTSATLFAVLEREPDRQAMQRAGLARDLQAVLLKALAKESERRYGSVDALAVDLEAYLSGHPVKAQPPTWAYETRKFVQRHVGAVTTTLVTGLTIVALGIWSLHSAKVAREQTKLAERRLESVRQIANKVVFDYNKALTPINGTLEVRKTIVSDALGYLKAQLGDAGQDLSLQAEIARGFEAVGDVQGGGLITSNLGDIEGARASFQQALALRAQACSAEPARTVAMNDGPPLPACSAQAATHLQLAESFMAQNKAPEAVEQAEKARALNSVVLAAAPQDLGVQALQYKALRILGGLSVRQSGDGYARGLTIAQQSLPLAKSLAEADPSHAAQERLRDASDFLANRLLAAGQPNAALPHIQQAVALGRKQLAAQASPGNAALVATSLIVMAEVQQHLLNTNEAQAHALEANDIMRKLHLADPKNMSFKGRYAAVGRRTGSLFNMAGNKLSYATSRRLLQELSLMSETFTPREAVFFYQNQLVAFELAKATFELGDAAKATQLLQRFDNKGAANPRAALDLANAYVLKAKLADRAGDGALATSLFDLALKPLKANAQQTPANKAGVANLALACLWASQSKALAAQAAEHKRCVSEQRKALADASALTPWWAKALPAD